MPKIYEVVCSNCGTKFIIPKTTYYYRLRVNPINTNFYCNKCTSVGRSNDIKDAQSKMTDKEKDERKKSNSERAKKQWHSYDKNKRMKISEIFSKAQKDRISNMSKDELAAYKIAQSEKAKEYQSKLTEEEKKAISESQSVKSKLMWMNFSEDEYNSIREKQSKGLKKYIDSLSDDELEARNSVLIDLYNNLPEERKDAIRRKLSECAKKRWNNMSHSEKKERMMILHEGFNEYFSDMNNIIEFSNKMKEIHQNKTDKEKLQYIIKMKEWRDSLSNEERMEYDRKRLISSSADNKLHKRFERQFSESTLSDLYYIKNEYPTSTNGNSHCWDYGIFDKDDKLICVIDLDGAYYHADNNDYDGIHSREEYDEKRCQSIPDGVKHIIIQEFHFIKDFAWLCKSILWNYDEFVDMLFKHYRAMPFPQPHYSDIELLKSYDSLCKMNCNDKYHTISLNTRRGDRLIQHFHGSIWLARRKGKISPYDAWNDDDILRQCIENRIIYQNHLNTNKILQGFNVSKIAPKVSVFSAGRAKLIISKYLSEFDEIFDPFSGFSGRMLGAVSLGKRYIGQDISLAHVNESNRMIEFLHDKGYFIDANIKQCDLLESTGIYQSLFTCPPYESIEVWESDHNDIKNCDDWIDECLDRFKCKKYLFVVDNTEKYKNNIVETIHNKSHFGSNEEYLIELYTLNPDEIIEDI